jgi:hypothetical protein
MEFAIPLLAVGGLFIVSNQDNQKNNRKDKSAIKNKPQENIEKFTNMGAKNNYLPNTDISPQNFPVSNESELVNTVQKYPNPNTATDKYFNQNVYENKQNKGVHVGNNIQQVYSLTGDYVAQTDFKHNNMIPFYGGKI